MNRGKFGSLLTYRQPKAHNSIIRPARATWSVGLHNYHHKKGLKMKIRELKRKDRKTVAAMIRKLVDKIGSTDLLNMIVTDSTAIAPSKGAAKVVEKTDRYTKIGVEIVRLMLEVIEDDVAVWFSDLLGVTIEQFDDLPVDIEIEVINQLIAAPESNRFFTGAWDLSRRTKEFAGKLSNQNSK